MADIDFDRIKRIALYKTAILSCEEAKSMSYNEMYAALAEATRELVASNYRAELEYEAVENSK